MAPRSRTAGTLPESDPPSDGLDQLRRIVADTLLEDCLDFADVSDLRGRVARQHDQVRLLPDRDRADLLCAAQVGRAVQGADLDRLERREPALDQQLDRALVRVAGNDPTAARRVCTSDQ